MSTPATLLPSGSTVDEFRVGDRVVVEAAYGLPALRELHPRDVHGAASTSAIPSARHRANGFTTNGGLGRVRGEPRQYALPDRPTASPHEEATVVMTSGSPLFGLENAGGYFAGETVAVLRAGADRAHGHPAREGGRGDARHPHRHPRVAPRLWGASWAPTSWWTAGRADPVAAVMEATGGKGADLVIDCAGGDDTFDQSDQDGEVGRQGAHRGLLPRTRHRRHESCGAAQHHHLHRARRGAAPASGRALALLAAGRLTAKPLVTHQFPLTRVHEAIETSSRSGSAIR